MNPQIFTEMVNDLITSKLLKGKLSTVLEKNVTKLFQNRKLIEIMPAYGQHFGQGGVGSVYEFGGDAAIKKTQVCRAIQSGPLQKLCDIANKYDDIQYETVDTVLDKKKYILPNHILELLCGIYLSHKLKPFTDGIAYCMGGLYDKTRKTTYLLQERLIPIQNIRPNGFNGLSSIDYLMMLYEILMTLAISQDKYKFVHYDLHHGNLMFRDYGEVPKRRVYDTMFTTPAQAGPIRLNVRAESRYQPVIIDYGHSRFETDDVIVSPVLEFREDNGESFMDNHLYNPYYDAVSLLRSFMVNFKHITDNGPVDQRASALQLYTITVCILSYTFGDMAHNHIQHMFGAGNGNLFRIHMSNLCKKQVRSIKDIANKILNILYQRRTTPVVGADDVPALAPINIVNFANDVYNFLIGPGRYVQPNSNGDRHYDVRNLNLFSDFKVINAPLGLRIGGIVQQYAWQYENYRVSRTALGLTNNIKPYNLTRYHAAYNDDLHISCAVMWNPSARMTPFRFSIECCRIDTKRFLQDERIKEGITINGTFFKLGESYNPIGFFKKNHLTIDEDDINFNYASDYHYIAIDEDGNLSISDNNVLANQPNQLFDETRETSVFTSGPILVSDGVQVFDETKLSEVYYDGSDNVYYSKYLGRIGGVQPISNTFNQVDIAQFIPVGYQGANPPIPANIYIKDINHLRPGDLTHVLNPNPRSVIATTNNGLVLFFTFLGRNDSADPALVDGAGASGIDLIDLSRILMNQALIAPLQLPAAANGQPAQISHAINVDGGGSSAVTIKESDRPDIITSGQRCQSYPVGNIVAYTLK